jgi:hypothetical protein
VPDLAEQDDRRALGAPAQRTGLAPASLGVPKTATWPSEVGPQVALATLSPRRPPTGRLAD